MAADTDITVQKSTNGGTVWSAPVRVNDDPAGNVQTNPWVSVGPGGRVDVIWGDRRHPYPGGGKLADIYFASSTDNGATFGANRRVTDRTINVDVGRVQRLRQRLHHRVLLVWARCPSRCRTGAC